MHVKLEPRGFTEFDSDFAADMDMETTLLREELFGNPIISDVSESSSDDDFLQRISSDNKNLDDMDTQLPPSVWCNRSNSTNSSSGSTTSDSMFEFDYSGGIMNNLDQTAMEQHPFDLLMDDTDIKLEYSSNNNSHYNRANNVEKVLDFYCEADSTSNFKVSPDTPPVSPQEAKYHVADESSSYQNEIPVTLPPISSLMTTSVELQAKAKKILASARKSINIPLKTQPMKPQPIKLVTISSSGATKNIGQRTINIRPKNVIYRDTIKDEVNLSPIQTVIKCESDPIVIPSLSTHKIAIQKQSGLTHLNAIIPRKIEQTPTIFAPSQRSFSQLPTTIVKTLKSESYGDVRALKRQQRMIRNRESASHSRKKKKEYLTQLEQKLSDLDIDNRALKKDNERLQQRVQALESERAIMRAARFPVNRNSAALMGVAFFMMINLAPILNMFSSPSSHLMPGGAFSLKQNSDVLDPGDLRNVNAGFSQRSLLWFSGSDPNDIEEVTGNLSLKCPLRINASESIRIDNELRDLFEIKLDKWSTSMNKSDETVNALSSSPKRKPNHPKTKASRMLASTQLEAVPNNLAVPANGKALITAAKENVPDNVPNAFNFLYKGDKEAENNSGGTMKNNLKMSAVLTSQPAISSLMNSIDRRDDTYYVISFSSEHLLLPAISRNVSARPKMSLIVPMPHALDGKSDGDMVSFTQIDCEVMHTKLVTLDQNVDDISTDLKTHRNLQKSFSKGRAFRRSQEKLNNEETGKSPFVGKSLEFSEESDFAEENPVQNSSMNPKLDRMGKIARRFKI